MFFRVFNVFKVVKDLNALTPPQPPLRKKTSIFFNKIKIYFDFIKECITFVV